MWIQATERVPVVATNLLLYFILAHQKLVRQTIS
jgi:hypothetical protein